MAFLVAPALEQSDLSSHFGVYLVGCLLAGGQNLISTMTPDGGSVSVLRLETSSSCLELG